MQAEPELELDELELDELELDELELDELELDDVAAPVVAVLELVAGLPVVPTAVPVDAAVEPPVVVPATVLLVVAGGTL